MRANFFGRSGRWKEAAADLTKVVELDPKNELSWLYLAPLRVELGDLDGYESIRQVAMKDFGISSDQITALRATQICFLLPASGTIIIVSRLNSHFVEQDTLWQKYINGLVDYRRGRFDSAVEWTKKSSSFTGSGFTRRQILPGAGIPGYGNGPVSVEPH